jgi:hypothetical protein
MQSKWERALEDTGSAQSKNQSDGHHLNRYLPQWSGYEDRKKLDSPGMDIGNYARPSISLSDLQRLH